MQDIYKTIRVLIFVVCLGFIWQGCNAINPVEPTPTYIHIDSFTFRANPLLSGYPTTSQINNVWVYYNNNPVGAFDLPCTIPIITNGNKQVELYPGISMDGLGEDPLEYPFYMPDTFTLAPDPGKIITHEPVTEYYSDVAHQIVSNFIGNISLKWVGGDQPITRANGDTLGPASTAGKITLYALGDSSIDSGTITLTIPSGTLDAYIEFDYKSSLPFYVGLLANLSGVVNSTPYYLAGIYPSATWQKFYLNVADFNNQYQATSYNFYIKTSVPGGSINSGEVLIENIQLLTF